MEPEGDTVVSTRYPLREAVAILSETRRHVSFEVGAMIAMELCEREIEGYHLDPDRIWIDVVGHLIVSKLKTPRGGLGVVLHDLEDALHPAARTAFRQTLEAAVEGEGRAADLRERFANFLYPIDRASARDTLARCLDQASRQLKRKSRKSSRPPRSDDRKLLGAGPDSIEVVLSGLDDSVFQQMPREVSIQLELGPQATDDAPQRLGRFHIFGEIARGGMAQVLLARDPEDGDKICVVKRMLPGLSLQRSFRNMFTDEARLGLCLDHPHICRTLEFLSVADEPCIKMEWAPGLTLSDLLLQAKRTRTTLSIGFALRLGEALASALSYAHHAKGPDGKALRVVHRDVSPQNVIVQYDGSIKLLDFGVARSAVQTTHSVVGSVKGKFAYMSPEQSLGMPIDERSDVFCLGICLFEALGGRPLFDREDRLAIVRSLARGEVPSITERREDVPDHVAELLTRCLSSEIEARPSMAELVDALKAAQLRVDVRPDEVTATIRALDPGWEDWRSKLNPFVRDLPADPSQQAPTRPWQAVTELAATEVLDAAELKRRTDPTVPLRSSKSIEIEPSVEISTESMEVEVPPERPVAALRAVALALVVGIVVLAVWFARQSSPPVTEPRVQTPNEPETIAAEPLQDEPNQAEPVTQAQPVTNSDAGTTDDSDAALEEAPSELAGALLVQTDPPGARVTLDGTVMSGRTPHRYANIADGSHRVLIRMRGYQTELRWVLIRGRNVLLRVELVPRGNDSESTAMGAMEAMQPVTMSEEPSPDMASEMAASEMAASEMAASEMAASEMAASEMAASEMAASEMATPPETMQTMTAVPSMREAPTD